MMKLAQLYSVILYGKCGMSFLKIKLHEEKSYRVSPNVTSNFFEPTSQMTYHIQLIGSCITGITCHTGMPF